MVKRFVGIAVFVLLYSKSYGQWSKIDTLHADYKAIYFVNDTLGFLCGDNGLVKKTTDGAHSWTYQNIDTKTAINSIYFINTQTGFATSFSYIYKSTDGGNTWTLKLNGPGYVYNLRFVNDSIGYAVYAQPYSGVKIFKTTNTGETWNALSEFGTGFLGSYRGGDYLADFDISDNNLIIGVDGGLFLNYNLEKDTWSYVVDTTSGTIDGMSAPSPNEALASFSGNPYYTGYGGIYKSIDGGATWQYVLVASISTLQMINNSIGYACGFEGIVQSSDGGSTWQYIDSLDKGITSMSISPHYGYAISFDHLIKKGNILKRSLITGIEAENRKTVSVLPNPFSNELNIQSEIAGSFSLKITGLDGKVYYDANRCGPKITVNTESFSLGMYFVELFDHGRSQVFKIIKGNY